jgi:proteasome lid subunit RPN8/RPN11
MKIAKKLLDEIISHAREVYPDECCGLLIGRRAPALVVTRVARAVNQARAHAQERYEIDPREFHQIDKTTWGKEEEIIGFYHSHPDHPPLPSAFDAARAWPSYCYLIVSLQAPQGLCRAWIWREASSGWEEASLEVEG